MSAATASWCNFRQFVGTGDAANSVVNLGEKFSTSNPKVAGLYSQGWIDANTLVGDQSLYSSSDHIRGYGRSTANMDSATWHLEGLTVNHVYRCYMGQAALFADAPAGFTIYSDAGRTVPLFPQAGRTVPGGQIMDIAGNLHANAADWLNNQSYQDITATSTAFYICKSSNDSWMNAFGIEDVTPVAATGSTAMMMGV